MYRTACGQELPDEARFCLRCGAPQGTDAEDAASTHWESARIVWQKSGLSSQRFEADVTTPTGTYRICDPQRETFYANPNEGGPQRNDRTIVSAHRALVERLIREGFEPVGVGDVWWAERFRRPAGRLEHEHCDITLQRSRFVADALGAEGHYSAGESEKLSGLTRRKKIETGQPQLASLVEKLRQDNWEPVEPWGREPWQQRFRRSLV